MQTEPIPVGKMPWAILTMNNMTNRPVIIRSYRVHVDGKDGERQPRSFSDR